MDPLSFFQSKGESILASIDSIVGGLEEKNADKIQNLKDYEEGNTYHSALKPYEYNPKAQSPKPVEAIELGHIEATIL